MPKRGAKKGAKMPKRGAEAAAQQRALATIRQVALKRAKRAFFLALVDSAQKKKEATFSALRVAYLGLQKVVYPCLQKVVYPYSRGQICLGSQKGLQRVEQITFDPSVSEFEELIKASSSCDELTKEFAAFKKAFEAFKKAEDAFFEALKKAGDAF